MLNFGGVLQLPREGVDQSSIIPSTPLLKGESSQWGADQPEIAERSWAASPFLGVGGWTNPFEKYCSNWNSAPTRGENEKNVWNHPLVNVCNAVHWKIIVKKRFPWAVEGWLEWWNSAPLWSYCWWKKSCITWDVQNPLNNGINHLSTVFVHTSANIADSSGCKTSKSLSSDGESDTFQIDED